MRIKIRFRVLRQANPVIPLSYQYEVSSWLYGLFAKSDVAFSRFLHEEGYVDDGKKFKLFTFSDFDFRPFRRENDRVRILGDEISIVLSFLVEQAAEKMIMGLFQEQQVTIGDKHSRIKLEVASVEILPLPEIKDTMCFQTLSPILVARGFKDEKGKLEHEYIAPGHEKYEALFLQNLVDKYKAAFAHKLCPPLMKMPSLSIECKNDVFKRRLVKIRADTKGQTQIRGFSFDFTLKTDPVLMRVGYLAGFGGENAMGFGCVGVLK